MNPIARFDVAQYPRRLRWLMAIAWLVIAVKCWIVWWAIGYWHMPFHPMWIVAPTVVFALLATGLWIMHREE
jgi:hypothetical protein